MVGIAGNETRVSRLSGLKVLRAESWVWGGIGAAVLVAFAWVYGVYTQFEPFGGGPIRPTAAIPIALSLVAAAFLRVSNQTWAVIARETVAVQPSSVLAAGTIRILGTIPDPPPHSPE